MDPALFEEDGPMEQYLRDAREVLVESNQSMPGTSLGIVDEISSSRYTEEELEAMEWRPKLLIDGLDLLESFLSSSRPPSTLSPFVEKFKYIVISSSLLSTTLSSSTSLVHSPHKHAHTSSEDASLPGKLALSSPTHDRPTTAANTTTTSKSGQPQTAAAAEPLPHYAYLSLAALVASVVLSLERRWLATVSLGGLSYLVYNLFVGIHEETSSYDFSPTINALDDLIEANKTWETIVQDSLQYLEREESSFSQASGSLPYHHPRSSTPTNALRIALNSTLQTTRNQCENVRQLFSALTCPSELAQLSVMYAPPSPAVKSPLLLPAETSFGGGGGPGLTSPRPYSFPPRSSPGSPDATLNKRSTWSGPPAPGGPTYTSLAGLGSPTTPFRRRDRTSMYQRTGGGQTNLSALFETGSPTPSTGSVNTPVTPFQSLHLGSGLGAGKSLAQIAEDLHGGFEPRERSFAEEDEEGDEQVLEYPKHLGSDASLLGEDEDGEELFGSIALDMQRRKKADGMGPFELPSPPPPASATLKSPSLLSNNLLRSPGGSFGRHGPHQQRSGHRLSTFTSSSRFTSIQPPRHPLSLFALNQALQAALLSRRYTCSHLLALRFSEEASLSSSTSSTLSTDPAEREEYWENVKSVVELLTTTFEGEASRLAEALEDVERQWGLDEIPTPNVSGEYGEVVDPKRRRARRSKGGVAFGDGDETTVEEDEEGEHREEEEGKNKPKTRRYDPISFAPMPSHLSRFAAHVAAISGALEDAREQLEEVVAALKENGHRSVSSSSSSSDAKPTSLHSKKKSSLAISVFPHANQALFGQHSEDSANPAQDSEEDETVEHKALQAYERLRRELGMALRECERGRQRLTEIVHPPVLPSSSDEEDESEGVPQLGHDTSDDSDKPEPVEDDPEVFKGQDVELVTDPLDSLPATLDNLLQRHSTSMTTLEQELALDGAIEQVYEADTGLVGGFSREKSKLSREERIQAVKSQRERAASRQSMSLEGLSDAAFAGGAPPVIPGVAVVGSKVEKWGPGGEVVQELKDVIYKVGERRRKMMEQAQAKQEKGKEVEVQPQAPIRTEEKGLDVVQEEDASSLLPYL
ncbi:hypothetical protein BKA70DRAFT_1368135 [Coprinopsis sp. MPI-PUGE-AT-0042]|nr:hypothetical protein BKA70DRAFT_1368135 [Coprinopsis sp. MPI-PUGE-AT-0042]